MELRLRSGYRFSSPLLQLERLSSIQRFGYLPSPQILPFSLPLHLPTELRTFAKLYLEKKESKIEVLKPRLDKFPWEL